jgi:hypothetical protein
LLSKKMEKLVKHGWSWKDVQIAETHRDRDVKIVTNKDREVSLPLRMSTAKRYCKNISKCHCEKGENEARIIAQSEATRRAWRSVENRFSIWKVQSARALEESYVAEQKQKKRVPKENALHKMPTS